MYRVLGLTLAMCVTLASAICIPDDGIPDDPMEEEALCPAATACLEVLENDVSSKCEVFPVPTSSLPRPVREVGYNLTLLEPNLWVYFDGAYFTLLSRDEKRLVVIDFPESAGTTKGDGSGTRITDAVEEIMEGDLPDVVTMVYSHEHFDHIGTATLFYTYVNETLYPDANIEILGTAGTAEALLETTSGRAPNVTREISENGESIVLGDLEIKMMLIGGHTQSDMLVYVPGVMAFLVDVIFPGWVPFRNFALARDLREYLSVHDILETLKFKYFIGGHLTRIGTMEDVEINREYSLAVIESAKTAVAEASDFASSFEALADPTSPRFGDLWQVFSDIRDLQTQMCFRNLVEKVGCKLGGLTSMGPSHCFTAVQFVIIDL